MISATIPWIDRHNSCIPRVVPAACAILYTACWIFSVFRRCMTAPSMLARDVSASVSSTDQVRLEWQSSHPMNPHHSLPANIGTARID